MGTGVRGWRCKIVVRCGRGCYCFASSTYFNNGEHHVFCSRSRKTLADLDQDSKIAFSSI
jgi:hypothetical protein